MTARRILLTGTEGVGKRSIAAVLEAGHGFRHLEGSGSPGPAATERLLLGLFDAMGSQENVVVTWSGDCPEAWVEILHSLRFGWFWLDSDRGASCPGSIQRPGTRPICAPRPVDPFEEDGSFRCLDDVVAELLEPHRAPTEPAPVGISLTSR